MRLQMIESWKWATKIVLKEGSSPALGGANDSMLKDLFMTSIMNDKGAFA